MGNDLQAYDEGGPVFADDSLLAIAKMAEARIDAVIKIKQLSLKVTNASDWNEQQGKPYLQVSGAEKIANLFNISWGFVTPEPLYEQDDDGHYTYTFKGRFSMGGRSIEVEGSRSSRDSFFKQNVYENGKLVREKGVEERDNKRDVKMAALTNLLGNGITRLLGIRNLTWEDLEKYAEIKRENIAKVDYRTRGEKKEPLREPAKKGEIKDPDAPATEPQMKAIHALLGKLGISDDFEKHKKVSRILKPDSEEVMTSLSGLTKGQASQVIVALTEEGSGK